MLSDRNVRELNSMIEKEMREMRWADTHAEKLECVDRIAKLKELLHPQPSRKQILADLAEALAEVPTPAIPQSSPLIDLLRTFITRQQ